MSTDTDVVDSPSVTVTTDGPYDQFLLFGDSITQGSDCQELGFAFAAALQDGNTLTIPRMPPPRVRQLLWWIILPKIVF